MSEWLALLASLLAGTLLGLAFFWGLWVTVRHLEEARHPAIWMLGSLILRLGLCLSSFYVIARYGGWEHLLAALIGFVTLRIFTLRRFRRRISAPDTKKEKPA